MEITLYERDGHPVAMIQSILFILGMGMLYATFLMKKSTGGKDIILGGSIRE